MRVLPQELDYRKPYKRAIGFTERWWHDPTDRVGDDPLGGKEYLQFLVNGDEIGRAEISDWQLSDAYVGIDENIATKQIWFFEIRQDSRRHGYGAEFAHHLIKRYPGIPLIAFSEGADEFWKGIGWHYYPREDGMKWPDCSPLFASEELNQ